METGYLPVQWDLYDLYYLFHRAELSYLAPALKGYEKIAGGMGDFYPESLSFYRKKSGLFSSDSWIVMDCPNETGFYVFHNLLGWMGSYGKQKKLWPKLSMGVAIRWDKMEQSYCCSLDLTDESQDTLTGYLYDGSPLQIYLPEAYKEQGNIMRKGGKDSDHEMWKVMGKHGFKQSDFVGGAFIRAEKI